MKRWLVVLAACGRGTGVTADAPEVPDALDASVQSGSRCMASGATLSCASATAQIGGRTVTFQVPLGNPPAAGWPAVIYYQGSLIPGSHAFSAAMSDSFGQYQLTQTVQALLDRGYAVIAPNTLGNGGQWWQTNVPPYSTSWAGCDDDVFVHALLAATLDGTTFGPLDATRRYAMGISSGGFMTSRMAVSYDGEFRALAIASASYATCSNTCSVPKLPMDHPPTLFLHGANDSVVPESAMTPYRDALVADGREAMAVIDPNAGHQWLAEAITAIPDWFDAH